MVTRPLITVVDDDESVRESLPDLLKEFGFEAHARDTDIALVVPRSQVVGGEHCFNPARLLTKRLKVRILFAEPKTFLRTVSALWLTRWLPLVFGSSAGSRNYGGFPNSSVPAKIALMASGSKSSGCARAYSLKLSNALPVG